MFEEQRATISNEVKSAIRREAAQQTAKWVIGFVVLLAGFALTGWWLFFEPKIRDYIADAAGGVPAGAVLASTAECQTLPGKWVTFTEGTGRFLVGAGSEKHRAYEKWDMALAQGGVQPTDISTYVVLAKGGEEAHMLTVPELATHAHATTLSRRWGDKSNQDVGWGSDDGWHPEATIATSSAGEGSAHNNMPPFVALYFCRKS